MQPNKKNRRTETADSFSLILGQFEIYFFFAGKLDAVPAGDLNVMRKKKE